MKKNLFVLAALLLGVLVATSAYAQWRGMGRMNGKVVDESGAAVEGATVKAVLPSVGGSTETKTDAKGNWILGGVSRGEWEVTLSKPGMTSAKVKVDVVEMQTMPTITVTLKHTS